MMAYSKTYLLILFAILAAFSAVASLTINQLSLEEKRSALHARMIGRVASDGRRQPKPR